MKGKNVRNCSEQQQPVITIAKDVVKKVQKTKNKNQKN